MITNVQRRQSFLIIKPVYFLVPLNNLWELFLSMEEQKTVRLSRRVIRRNLCEIYDSILSDDYNYLSDVFSWKKHKYLFDLSDGINQEFRMREIWLGTKMCSNDSLSICLERLDVDALLDVIDEKNVSQQCSSRDGEYARRSPHEKIIFQQHSSVSGRTGMFFVRRASR